MVPGPQEVCGRADLLEGSDFLVKQDHQKAHTIGWSSGMRGVPASALISSWAQDLCHPVESVL